MVEAYVLVQAVPGPSGQSVSREIRAISGVVSVDDVSGPYDVIARIQGRTLDDLFRRVVSEIQSVEGVIRTLPCTVVHFD